MTTKTKPVVLTDRDAAADLAGEPRPDNPTYAPEYDNAPEMGRVTVERWQEVFRSRANAVSNCREQVKWIAERFPASTNIRVLIGDDTSLRMDLDDLMEIAAALCPPWLLRKKLGL